MESSYHLRITECEKRFLEAIKTKDLDTLDELIHEDVLFLLPNGHTLTKPNVLDNYREGNIMISTSNSSDVKMHVIGDTVVVSLKIELQGRYFDQVINSNFRYLRVWKLFFGHWKIIAVSGVQLPEHH